MMLARFADEESLAAALGELRAARLGPLETYTPAPLAGVEGASPVPLIVLIAGVLGFAASFGLQTWSSTAAYRFSIGGRPNFAWPSFVPNAFENAILIAMAAGFVAFFIAARLTRLYDPVDEAEMMRSASSDGWIVAIGSGDSGVLARARHILKARGASDIELLPQ
jgi:hypothetical protein